MDSDRIEVFRDSDGTLEISCRFDLRDWKPDLYRRFIDCVRSIGGHLQTIQGESVLLEPQAFEQALRSSDAMRFVTDPHGFLRRQQLPHGLTPPK
jgi:hypothetical protein